jgi:hypothetical protein
MEKMLLARRPEARPFTVEALLQHVRDGRLRIPEFQRPLRWRSSHVLELFDSIYRGFPVGTLLLARGPAEASKLHFGPLIVAAQAMPDVYFVVDGQQRITALAGAMLHPDKEPRGDIHAIWFDLEKEKFVRAGSVEPPPHWIPLNAVGDSFDLLRWLNDWPYRNDSPELVQRAISLGKALREYQIPSYIVEGASREVLRIIFKRVNTSGVKMRESEVFEALYGAGEPRPIRAACARLSETGFGALNEEWFLRCVKAVEGLDPRHDTGEREQEVAGLRPEAVERTETALRRATGFLVGDAGIPHEKLLPYTLPLIILARFFSLHADPQPRTRLLLVRWVWRGALSGEHADSSNATVHSLLQQVDGDEAASAERLLGTIPSKAETPDASTQWYGQSAKARLCAIAMFHLAPRDPRTGEPMLLDELQARLSRRGLINVFPDVGKAKNSAVARHVLLPERRKIKLLAQATAEVLESHAMDPQAAAALERGDLDTFERRRERLLDRWLARFFAERSAAGDSDRPAISELLRRVDAKVPA